ncbi:hypothetical protein CEP53_003197 [Fusarium sp. AF-6]|nr:hypothetical protein CEP53_003197 [Fusarium sp. AF-6]
MLKDLPWPRKAAGQGVRVAEIVQDLAANDRDLFAPEYDSQLEILGAELSPRGTEPFSLKSGGDIREHLSIYHAHEDADTDVPSDGKDDSQDQEIKASILLPEKVKDQLSNIVKENGMAEFARDWTWLHAACFSSVDNDLRQFINYLDQEITKVFDRVIMFNMEPSKPNEPDPIQQTSKDLKTLQYLSDQARRLINIIELNIETLKCMMKEINNLRVLSFDSPHHASVEVLFNLLEKTQQEHRFSFKNASAVLDRARATSEQLRDTASLRNSEISKMSSEMTNLNTLAMAKLAEQSSRETRIVKTLTVLALIFVPASFVAMGFVKIVDENPMKWAATADLKIYAILALPLIGLTMLIYGCVEMMQRTATI